MAIPSQCEIRGDAKSKRMKQAIPIPWDTTQPEAFTCDMVHNMLQITRRLGGPGFCASPIRQSLIRNRSCAGSV